MRISHGLFGISEAELRAELDRRCALQSRRLKVAQERLARLKRANAAVKEELILLETQVEEALAEKQAMTLQLSEADAQRGDLPGVLSLACQREAEQQQQRDLTALKQRLQRYRSLRNQLTAGVLTLINPFLHDRSRKEGARNG